MGGGISPSPPALSATPAAFSPIPVRLLNQPSNLNYISQLTASIETLYTQGSVPFLPELDTVAQTNISRQRHFPAGWFGSSKVLLHFFGLFLTSGGGKGIVGI